MRVFNVITLILYYIISTLFIIILLSEELGLNYVLAEIGSYSVGGIYIFVYLIAASMILGTVSYVNSYKMFRFKILPPVAVTLLLWVLAFTVDQYIALMAVVFTVSSILYIMFMMLVLHFSNVLNNNLKDTSNLE